MTPQDAALLARLTGFTPGPWDLGKRYDSVISSNITGFDDALTVDAYGGHLVCESAKMKENAALIAAAPDLHRIATELAAENKRLRAERGELAACLFEAIDMLDEYSICNTGENFNNPRFNAVLGVQP